jgi:cyanophycin synthetase
MSGETVPDKNLRVLVKRNGNMAIDCTAQVHPEVAHIASLAARVIGLDIAGIDMVAIDIGKPLHEQGGAIVEVNAGPGLLMHLKPAEGMPQPVGQAIVDHLFAPDETGRIAIVGVTGSRGTATISRLVAWFLHLGGRQVGLACSEGLFMGNRQVEKRNTKRWDGTHRLLMNRGIDTVVAENDAASILNDGLAYDRCLIGVVTDLDGRETLTAHDVQDEAQLFKVLRTQVDVVLPEGVAVLNADDTRVLGMAELCDGQVILYSLDAHSPAVVAHRAAGGRAVFLRGSAAILATGPSEVLGAEIATLVQRLANSAATATEAGAQTVLAAVATAWALGTVPELIGAGLETFVVELSQPSATPGLIASVAATSH